MSAEALAQAGGVVGCSGLAVLIVADRRSLKLGGLCACALGLALFVPFLAPSGNRVLLAGAALVALLPIVGLAYLFRHYPWALAFVALAAAPVRFPLTVGETSANLLVPLYGVIAAAALALGWSLWRDAPRPRELGPLAWPLALLVLWFGVSILWATDVRNGAVTLFFYLLPFGLLAVALARLPWSSRAAGHLYVLLAAMATLFAAVGIWQWATHGVFWNLNVIGGNAYGSFYRVNSLFWDPSIYGRFLVIAILASLTLLLFGPRGEIRREVGIGFLILLFWLGLFFSFSQSSYAALFAGILLAVALSWRRRSVVVVGVAAAALVAVAVAVAASTDSVSRATGGRSQLVSNGVRIAADHPLAGVGVGGFRKAYSRRLGLEEVARGTASHNTPVTVAAETGIVGLLAFAGLLAAVVLAVRGRLRGETVGRRTAIVACLGLAAIFVHSLFYNAFFEDPFVWGFLALVAVSAQEEAAAAEAPAQSS